ncbi:diphthine--ammonia ligase [Methanoplanus sp. FWC-SCC4]|uniref:Diphthine--ammonia ligase n=1 Tax=Methanochimaera problematica TaxID=2609417 RepID=A0AA97I2G1_9EURY|nr:diphthine--ammonia ligase [Methanoplanus sp. FWC-SCC4]WOF16230.1 diphthine--ammonia ligase [Methanoplanus sp. FWC-SCC4]
MKLGVLFSGGKDSVFACRMAMAKEEVSCLITILSKNKESYMFHTPNVNLSALQAEAANIPLVEVETNGEKEKELDDLKTAILVAKEKYGIEGIVTGAIMSVYQASRVQRICSELDLWCFNPLWYVNQKKYMEEIISSGFKVMITGVFSYPFDETWLGRTIDEKTLSELERISEKCRITLTGEGGEFETFVYDAPFFSKKIVIDEYLASCRNYNGTFNIIGAHLEEK